MQPKLFFDTQKEMLDCLNEWKGRLALTDWWIAARICAAEDMKLEDCAGESEVQHINRCGLISIRRKEDLPDDLIIKQPQEMTLIHELLHFKFVGFEEESREEAMYELRQHQLLEDMAKALYMAKYNLKWDWFITDTHREGAKE